MESGAPFGCETRLFPSSFSSTSCAINPCRICPGLFLNENVLGRKLLISFRAFSSMRSLMSVFNERSEREGQSAIPYPFMFKPTFIETPEELTLRTEPPSPGSYPISVVFPLLLPSSQSPFAYTPFIAYRRLALDTSPAYRFPSTLMSQLNCTPRSLPLSLWLAAIPPSPFCVPHG